MKLSELKSLADTVRSLPMFPDRLETSQGVAGRCFLACRELAITLWKHEVKTSLYQFIGAPNYPRIAPPWSEFDLEKLEHHVLCVELENSLIWIDLTRRQFEPDADCPAFFDAWEVCSEEWRTVNLRKCKPLEDRKFMKNLRSEYEIAYVKYICGEGAKPDAASYEGFEKLSTIHSALWELTFCDEGEIIQLRP